MLGQFATILLCVIFTVAFVSVQLCLSKYLAPKNKSDAKSIPYECGELPQGTPFIQYNPRYYVFALAFLIFDVEIIFLYPCAVVLREWIGLGWGMVVLIEMLVFVSILFLGLAYLWKNGDLEWVKTIEKEENL